MHGNLYIVSAPSGSGKTTLLQHLLRSFKDLKFSVSYTTRRPRQGEQDGLDYFFTDRTSFLSMVQSGDFLEWAYVHGHRYGTLRTPVESALREGRDMLFDIDVQGARAILCDEHEGRASKPRPPPCILDRPVALGIDLREHFSVFSLSQPAGRPYDTSSKLPGVGGLMSFYILSRKVEKCVAGVPSP